MQLKNSYDILRDGKALHYADSLSKGFRLFPPSLQIGVTDHCFNTCIMCGHWKREEKHILKFESLKRFLNIGKSLGLETVCYSGGDPFAYADLNRLMRWHIRNNVDYGFITAGYLPKFVDPELVSHARFVRISLDSISHYDTCRGGVPFKLVDESIRKLRESRLCLGITITKYNYKDLEELVNYAILHNFAEVRSWVVRHELDLLPKDQTQLLQSLVFLSEMLDDAKIENNFDTAIDALTDGENISFPHCKATLYQLFINADGSIYPCCIVAGDTEDSSHAPAFGSINDISSIREWKEKWELIRWFSTLPKESLYPCCKSGCIPRLSYLNKYASTYFNKKEFI